MNKIETLSPETETLPVTQIIANFAVAPIDRDAAADAAQIARLSLLDWIAVAVAGRDEPVAKIVRDLVGGDGGTPEASVIGHDANLPARAAALSNGATSHALDYDDTHFIYLGHPTVAVMPAALALAEKLGSTGPAFLDAALVGLETACRIGEWLGRGHYQHGFHQTATSGSFGAAAAASRLLGLDAERTCHALGIAATKASGLKSQFGTMGKPYHAGLAAANGVEAALLAKAGIVSRPDGLECEQGFSLTHAGEQDNTSLAMGELGRKYVFTEVQHKFHACCHGTHAPVEALISARDDHGVSPADIESVELTVNPRFLRVCNIEQPATGLEAKFSFRLTAAMALSGYDTSALATFSAENCHEPSLVALRDKVSVVTDSGLSESVAQIRIDRRSNEAVVIRHDICDPMPVAVREAKVRAKAAALLGQDRAERCWLRTQDLGTAGEPVNLRELAEL
ncbi:MAG: MmgE/PrpD family protein [Alphaproteobacteria bacterium]|nr:MmgE/PrpD family protein [Alphaproteobacteria bacterium]